ncbi:hypothetical protein HIM_11362 [Hirsutella minnesotensis 3608]|uniref:Transcription factor domain-containing protein n=1 Tax=Hirsutella minnesotensis 3608 TaxID=1043627 RepID=A0A0F8A1A3_9HYPO|nr:hypothetical protein HIM_11362 [Hirsutella minnesotensis 3608]
MYSFIDPDTDGLAIRFCAEAERLWAIERRNERDSLTNIAAAEFLCLGYLGQGRDHAIVAYVSEASNMGKRMGLFGTQDEDPMEEPSDSSPETAEAARARMHTAWGPPSMAIPEPNTPHGPDVDSHSANQGHQPISSGYMGHTFPYVCRFWSILSEVSEVYSGDGQLPWGSSGSLSFAEFKFRELLAWSNSMPSRLSENHHNPHHVQILHLWFHAAILDIFRPHIQGMSAGARHLRTFASMAITPDAVCASSVAQMKYLITNYRLNYGSSACTILWHTALIYVINAILNGPKEENWYSDILLCVYAYESLGRSWRVAGAIAKGLLSLIMQKSDVPSRTARRILHDLERNPDHFPGEIRATFMVDLNLALSDPGSATVEHLAKQFEDNVLLKDYTTVLDNSRKQ